MHTQDMGDPQKAGDVGVGGPGLDLLVGGAADVGREKDRLLGAVLMDARDADAVADGATLPREPVVVVGQGWHAANALTKIIISQPG